jgi:hypothetical protein
LSQISSEYNLKSVDKIKINSSISKAEILSDGDFFQTFKPTILTEIKSNEKYLFNVLEKYGYKHSPVHELKIDLPLYIFSI